MIPCVYYIITCCSHDSSCHHMTSAYDTDMIPCDIPCYFTQLPLLPLFPPFCRRANNRSAAEPTDEPQPDQPVQQLETTVIQTEIMPDNLLIGDLLSLDIPAGPAIPTMGGGGGGTGGGLTDLAELDLLGDLGGLNVSGITHLYVDTTRTSTHGHSTHLQLYWYSW